MPTSLRAIAEKASTTGPVRKRTVLKSPVRENRTPGSVRGRSGNWPTYLDGCFERMRFEKPSMDEYRELVKRLAGKTAEEIIGILGQPARETGARKEDRLADGVPWVVEIRRT